MSGECDRSSYRELARQLAAISDSLEAYGGGESAVHIEAGDIVALAQTLRRISHELATSHRSMELQKIVGARRKDNVIFLKP